MNWLFLLDVPEQTASRSVPWWMFSKLQQGNEWTDSDEVRDKTRRGADEHDRAPALMDFFCGR